MVQVIWTVQAFILPAGLVILAGIGSCVSSVLKRRKLALGFAIASVSLLYLFAIEPVRDLILLPLENRYPPLSSEAVIPGSPVVILGGGTVQGSPEYSGAALAPGALKRTFYGGTLARRYDLPVVAAGGIAGSRRDAEPEALAARRALVTMGIEEDRVLTERESRTTWENAVFTAELLAERRIILVTSAYHMHRSIQSFRAQGFRCTPAPTDYRTNRSGYTFFSFLPSAGAFLDSSLGIHEYWGNLFYRLKFYRRYQTGNDRKIEKSAGFHSACRDIL